MYRGFWKKIVNFCKGLRYTFGTQCENLCKSWRWYTYDHGMVAVFRSTAEGETGHAHGHLEYLEETGDPATGKPIGPTSDNLAAAVAGETHEYTDMYPGMARTARDEGLDEIADWFETLAKAEKSHAGRFQKALDSLDD